MENTVQTEPAVETQKSALSVRIFGVGGAGINVVERMIHAGMDASAFVAVNTDGASLAGSSAGEKVHLESSRLRGLGTGGDPERGRALAEESGSKLKSLCEEAKAVFIVAGLGGGAGTGISPVLARTAKDAGALVLAFVVTPFDCEGSRRQDLAREGLEELAAAADGVIRLPNQKVFKLIDENTSVLDTFKLTSELLADGVRAVWRLMTRPGLIEIHFSEVCALMRDRHAESAFAVAEAAGATRSREVMDKLLAHPMLDGGEILGDSETVLVSLAGGPDLTMADVNRVMEQINSRCAKAQVIMGAAIEDNFRDRLAVTLIAARKASMISEPARPSSSEELNRQLLPDDAPRPGSRFVPPPPTLAPAQLDRIVARQAGGGARGRRTAAKLRQGQLPLEIVSKGRFDKSEPTIHKGEDLDVPTYIRRGVALN